MTVPPSGNAFCSADAFVSAQTARQTATGSASPTARNPWPHIGTAAAPPGDSASERDSS